MFNFLKDVIIKKHIFTGRKMSSTRFNQPDAGGAKEAPAERTVDDIISSLYENKGKKV